MTQGRGFTNKPLMLFDPSRQFFKYFQFPEMQNGSIQTLILSSFTLLNVRGICGMTEIIFSISISSMVSYLTEYSSDQNGLIFKFTRSLCHLSSIYHHSFLHQLIRKDLFFFRSSKTYFCIKRKS